MSLKYSYFLLAHFLWLAYCSELLSILYYMCRTSFECFPDEKCVDGFCCPYITFSSPSPTLSAASDIPETTSSLSCPDGSAWVRMCKKDTDCIFGEEICANGKCCGSCRQRRLQVLRELQNFVNIYGAYVPQCSGDGRFYHEKQCMSGTNECWCVTDYGERIAPSLAKSAEELNCEELRQSTGFFHSLCITTKSLKNDSGISTSTQKPEFEGGSDTAITDSFTTTPKNIVIPTSGEKFTENPIETTTVEERRADEFFNDGPDCKQYEETVYCHYSKCQASCQNPHTKSCATRKCIDGCHCRPGYIRLTDDPKSECVPLEDCKKQTNNTEIVHEEQQDFVCTDPLMEYTYCGSPCPMSCETRWDTPCVFDRCVKGCFCKMPYILESNRDPNKVRCILPAQCPLMKELFHSSYQEEAPRSNIDTPFNNNFFGNPLSTTITLHRCPDPLKNYLRCGSTCPPACNQIRGNCTLDCAAGCFCRTPYILKDIEDVNSQCVLPQHCPSKQEEALETGVKECKDPRKVWTTCFSKKCIRTCSRWQPFCSPTDCQPGCECRPPYVMKDLNDPESPCVLPDECPKPEVIPVSKCKDPLKEFHSCASSCPLACDNLHPQVCTPCISGCFCKNGYVLENSKNWVESECVRINQCIQELPESVPLQPNPNRPQENFHPKYPELLKPRDDDRTTIENDHTQINSTQNEGLVPEKQPESESEPKKPGEDNGKSFEIFRDRPHSQSVLIVPSYCPKTPKDRGGRTCLSDFDCGFQQRCCNISAGSIFPDPLKCTCLDPNAIWMECGTLCPEYCGQAAPPRCSPTCNPGCHCAPGYTKARNDLVAPCVPKNDCSKIKTTGQISHKNDGNSRNSGQKSQNRFGNGQNSTRNDINSLEHDQISTKHGTNSRNSHDSPSEAYGYAGAELYHKDGSLLGKFVFIKINGKFTLNGKIYSLPKNALDFALDVHQFGDSIASGCRHIGWSIGINGDSRRMDDAYTHNWLRIHVEPDARDQQPFAVERTLDHGDLDSYQAIIGRSLVLHRLVKNDETGQFLTGEPVSCATIGFYQL